MKLKNGGIIGPENIASKQSASGMWTLANASEYFKDGLWPQIEAVVSLTPNKSSVDEGDNVVFNGTTVGFEDNTDLYWTINEVTGNINEDDFDDGLLSGSVTVINNSFSITRNIAADAVPEGEESFSISIRRDSTSGRVIFTSPIVIINDTSFEPPAEDWTGNVLSISRTNSGTEQNICNIYFRRAIMMWVYTSAELQAAFGKSSTTISGLRFFVNQQPLNQPLPNYAIGMKNGSFGTASPGGTEYTVVKSPSSESFVTNTTKTFEPFNTSFNWTGGDLAIIFAWGQNPVDWNASGTSGVNSSGTMWFTRTDASGTYVINQTTPTSTVSYRPVVQLYG
jgi:hypothetical protein